MSSSIRERARRRKTKRRKAEVRRSVFDVVPSPYFSWSPWLARVLAAVLLIPALPIILSSVVLIRLTSPGPGLFRQIRAGLRGNRFMMYKLRTMHDDAEAKTGPIWTRPGDPRITRVGRFMRFLHLDELPQLFNVIKGEMALIGPRPERPEFIHRLAPQIPGYMNRLSVLPGVTGLAQINLPPDATATCVCRKLILDVDYIEKGNLFMDLRIYLCTLLRIFGIRGELPAKVLFLYRIPILDSDSCLITLPGYSPSLAEEPALGGNGREVPLPHGKNGASRNGKAAARRRKSRGRKIAVDRVDRDRA